MRIAIMQPYFLPYIGYFQLVNQVDKFIIYDDVDFINRGWINRNQMLLNGNAYMFTLPLSKASQNRKIKEIELIDDRKWKKKFKASLIHAYGKAPYFDECFPLIESIIDYENRNLSSYVFHSIIKICQHCNIEVDFVETSSIYQNDELSGANRILDICAKEEAEVYLNPEGGQLLYNQNDFKENGITLKFIKTLDTRYSQFGNTFVKCLSIVDVLMFVPPTEIKDLLNKFELIPD